MIALSFGILTTILCLGLAAIGMPGDPCDDTHAAAHADAHGGVQVQAAAPETPFYCNLKALSPAERTTHQATTKRLLGAVRDIREIADGYAFDLDSHQVTIADIASWVAFEQRCCPFFDFRVDWHRENGPLSLQLGGRDGVKDFIRTEFKPAFR
jgi:hypothetical protein